MFFKNKIIFFIVQFLFCILLVYFINQQLVPIGIFDNFIIELIVLYILILFISNLISKIFVQLYILLLKIIKQNIINTAFASWLLFTLVCYILTFIIFALSIEYWIFFLNSILRTKPKLCKLYPPLQKTIR